MNKTNQSIIKLLAISTTIAIVLKFFIYTSLPLWFIFLPLIIYIIALVIILIFLTFLIIISYKKQKKKDY